MIPILFEESSTVFTSNGIGRLTDCTSCLVTEERNGIYELELQYPVSGPMAKEIQVGRTVYATHDNTNEPQPFRIYNVTSKLENMVTAKAEHISYKLNQTTVLPFSAISCSDAMSKIPQNIIGDSPFTFWTDKAVTKQYRLEKPSTVRNILGGSENSFLDVFGTGEYEWDHFTVKLHLNRGASHGVTIRYGKNLVSLEHQRDKEGTFNAVVPYYLGEDGTLVTLPEWVVYGSGYVRDLDLRTDDVTDLYSDDDDNIVVGYTEVGIVPLDLTDQWETPPTVSQLRNKAQSYLNNNEPWEINENITVDFVQLWQTEEYANVEPLQRIALCDTVGIIVPGMDVNAQAKCISVTYDSLNERYTRMELGKAKMTFSQVIAEVSEKAVIPKVVTKSNMNQAIYEATQKILGGGDSYAQWVMLNGNLSELLFMDQPGIEASTYILRINRNGIGFSNDGGQSFHTAWTLDGKFNADFITAGTLRADLIKAGILSDEAGNNTWDMESGILTTKKLNITELLNVNAGAGSYIKIPISDTDPDNNFIEIKNTSPQLTVLAETLWGGTYYFTFDPENGLVLTDGDTETYIQPGKVSVERHLNNWQIVLETDGVPSPRLYVSDGNGNYSIVSANAISTTGTKNRIVNGIPFYAYETVEGYFGDIGEDIVGEDGYCTVNIADTLRQAVLMPYQVFLQSYGETSVSIHARYSDRFVVKGMVGTRFAWEVKAKQI